MLKTGSPGDFERHVAAVTDVVFSRFRHPVVLVTTPPYLSDPVRAREFAFAIRRVADARGIPVADLYSAFMGMGSVDRFFAGNDLELSEDGARLTAQVIARALTTN
jgi:hypothetical protein